MTAGSVARRTRDANFRPVSDSDEQVSSSTTCSGQTFSRNADDFSASHAARDIHAQARSRWANNKLCSSLRRSLRSDAQVAAQIGATNFETMVRPYPHPDVDFAAIIAGDFEARAWRGFGWNSEWINFRAIGLGGVIHAHIQRGATEELLDPQMNILVQRGSGFGRGPTAPFRSLRRRVVSAPKIRVHESVVCGVQILHAQFRIRHRAVHIGMQLLGEQTIGAADLFGSAVPVEAERRVVIWLRALQAREA
jgi:hypothetical protein